MRPARWWCALVLAFAPVVLLFLAVYWLGVNTLIADEFTYVEFIRLVRDGGPWTTWLLLQHNEHRVVPMKLVMVLLQGPTRWSQLAEMFCSAGLSTLMVVVFWRVYRVSGGRSSTAGLLAFAPIAWFVSSLSQYENQFFGMMMCHYFTALGAAAGLWLLARGDVTSTILALLAAGVAAFSIGSGFLTFPAGGAILLAQRASAIRWVIWCGGGAVLLARYLRDYITPPHTHPFQWTLENAYAMAALCLTTIGAPLAAGSVAWGSVAGAALLTVVAILLVRWLRADQGRWRTEALAISLVLFGLASAAMVGVGRSAMHGNPLGSRYITYANFAWIGAYLLMLQDARAGGDRRWWLATWGLLVPGLLAANLHGLGEARTWHRERVLDQYVLQTYYLQPDPVVARLGPAPGVKLAADYLRAEGLTAFAEPQRIVMMIDPAGALASAEIVRGQGIEQRFLCPVEDLYDVGVLVLPAARPGTAVFRVTVSNGPRELASLSIESATIKAWTWVRVPLATPLRRCAGSDLSVRVDSESVEVGSGVGVLASQPYYEGTLTQAGAPMVDRRLAVSLNAFRDGVLP